MEIILKENVANVGFKDEVVTVKPGYGRNFLIPTGKAVLATESAKKVLAENLKQKAFKEKSIIDDAEKLAYTIQNKNSGFYNLIEYTAPADLVSSLEVEFSRDETIMRYLTVTLDKDALAWAEKRRNRNTKKAS